MGLPAPDKVLVDLLTNQLRKITHTSRSCAGAKRRGSLPAPDKAPVDEAEREGLQGAAEAVDGQLHAPRLLLQQRRQSACMCSGEKGLRFQRICSLGAASNYVLYTCRYIATLSARMRKCASGLEVNPVKRLQDLRRMGPDKRASPRADLW